MSQARGTNLELILSAHQMSSRKLSPRDADQRHAPTYYAAGHAVARMHVRTVQVGVRSTKWILGAKTSRIHAP